jgi:hypothetical protein
MRALSPILTLALLRGTGEVGLAEVSAPAFKRWFDLNSSSGSKRCCTARAWLGQK